MQTESLVPVLAVEPGVVTNVITPRPTHTKVPQMPPIEPLPSLDELLANADMAGQGWRGWLRGTPVPGR